MSNAPEPKRRWFYPQPVWLIVLSLATTVFLFLSERYRLFAFNQHKGWTVLIAVTSVAAVLAVMLLWWLAALVFRWRLQFSIRSLLVLAIAVALPCSWLAVAMKRARDQRKAVEAIETITPFVTYDWLVSEANASTYGLFPPNPQPPEAEWLRNIVGDDFFANVVWVGMGGEQVTDTALRNLRGFPTLQELAINRAPVTDAGLENLRGLTALRKLWLHDTQVTDTGVENLQQALPNCKIER